MKSLILDLAFTLALGALVAMIVMAMTGSVQAAPSSPWPEDCEHVATADTVKIFYCEGLGLFVNQLGFMVFEP